MCLVIAMAATAVIGGTLAYFTDTDTETNTFTFGNVKIDLVEKGLDENDTEVDFKDAVKELHPGKENAVKKSVTVKNEGTEDAYMWIEVWVPSALDDGDDNSPHAPGLGNSLHFNYAKGITETKATFLGSKDGYNGYVHYVAGKSVVTQGNSTPALLDQVYMDKKVAQCEDTNCQNNNCLVLMDEKTHYAGAEHAWELKINAVGFQADGIETIEDAITIYYNKDVTEHIW